MRLRDDRGLTARLKRALSDTWLFPRHITRVYISAALREALDRIRGRLLDIGCGTSPYARLLRDHVTSYVGMDWPGEETPASPQVVGDAMRLPFISASMDTVLATEVMEHVPDPDAFLGEIGRVLRPGGCVLLSVPFIEPLHEQPRDFYRFTPYSLRLLLVRHGFEVNRISTRGGWWSVVLGSLVTQTIYDFANPPRPSGKRPNGVTTAIALPLCAVTQLVAYALDRIVSSPRHTLGFVAVATRL